MNILIVKTSALGDIIHAFPVLTYLRIRYPNANIDWVVESSFAELVQAHPDVNSVICIHTKKWRKKLFSLEMRGEIGGFIKLLRQKKYDLVIDLQGNIKSGLVTFLSRGSNKLGFGFKTVPEWPNLLATNQHFNPPKGKNIRDDYLFLVQSYFGDFTDIKGNIQLRICEEEKERIKILLAKVKEGKKILLCPGSNWANKQVSKESLCAFLSLLSAQEKCAFFYAWGTTSEKEIAEDLMKCCSGIVIEKFSLPTLQNFMCHMDVVIAMDSLPLHLAATTSTKTFSVFGASSASKYAPTGKNHITLQGSCPFGKTFEKRCPILRTCSTGGCIKSITGEQLFEKFNTMLVNVNANKET